MYIKPGERETPATANDVGTELKKEWGGDPIWTNPGSVSEILRKFISDDWDGGAETTLVVPANPLAPCWMDILDRIVDYPIIVPGNKKAPNVSGAYWNKKPRIEF